MAGVDTYLSDVHVGTCSPISRQGTAVSRFVFTQPHRTDPSEAELDEDGDLLVQRREHHVFLIEHAMSTTLDDVGLQVWRGSLLMADYLFCQKERLQESLLLELGAGTGLVSVTAALTAQCVFCTDTGRKVLQLCQHNIKNNISEMEDCGSVRVRELDWSQPFSPTCEAVEFSWSLEDMETLTKVSLILACDVIYDDNLTDSFFNCLVQLHSIIASPPIILLTLEKRINFSLEELSPVGNYYKYFRQCLQSKYPLGSRELKFEVHRVDTDFAQYSVYNRVKELELWELMATITDGPSTAR